MIGIDTGIDRVTAVNRDESYIQDVSSERLARVLSESGPRLSADGDYRALSEADVAII